MMRYAIYRYRLSDRRNRVVLPPLGAGTIIEFIYYYHTYIVTAVVRLVSENFYVDTLVQDNFNIKHVILYRKWSPQRGWGGPHG